MAKNRSDSMPAIAESPSLRFVKAACPQLPARGSRHIASGAIDELNAAVGTALRPVCGLDGTNRSESAQLGVHKGADRSRQTSSRRRHAVFYAARNGPGLAWAEAAASARMAAIRALARSRPIRS